MGYKVNQYTKCGYLVELFAMEGNKPRGVLYLSTSDGEKLMELTYSPDGKVVAIEGHDVKDYPNLDIEAWEMENNMRLVLRDCPVLEEVCSDMPKESDNE